MLAAQSVWAHASRPRVGVTVGTVWSPFWVPSPWYYPPPFIFVPQPAPVPPPVYIEQNPVPEPDTDDYWYYCSAARAYYPAIKTCPEGWLPILPQTE
jgi:hypothetical protein